MQDHAASLLQNKCRQRNAKKEAQKRRNWRLDAENKRLEDEERMRIEEESEQVRKTQKKTKKKRTAR